MSCSSLGTPCGGANQCCYPYVCVASGGNKIGAPVRPGGGARVWLTPEAGSGGTSVCNCIQSTFGPCSASVECCSGVCNGGVCQ